MKIKKLVFIAIAAMSGIGPANAEYPHQWDVLRFKGNCERPDRPSQIKCEAFLVGVVDTVNTFSFWGELDKNYFCIPEGITDGRLRKVFVGYVATKGGVDLFEPAASLVIRAFGEAFPCE